MIESPATLIANTKQLFRVPLTSGVYRYIGPTWDTLEALQGVGWRAVHIMKGDTLTEFFHAIGEAFGLDPKDEATVVDLAVFLRELSEPTALLWTSWHELAIEHPYDWAKLMDVLEERTNHAGVPFALVIG